MKSIIVRNYSITTPIYDIVRDIQEALHRNKLKIIKLAGDRIRVTCPSHKNGQESHPSCGIYIGEDTDKVKYGEFHCFTCNEGGPFYHFVAECFDKDDEWAKDWLIEKYGNVMLTEQMELPEIAPRVRTKQTYLDESVLLTFQKWHPYLAKRKLTPEVCEKFEVKYDPRTQCVVFPVRDDKGKLIMLTRRSVVDKTFIIDKDKEKPLYLYYYIKEKDIQEVTIVESQINCLTLWSWGIPSIAMFGCALTEKQEKLLNSSNLKHIYLALDGDNAGHKGMKALINRLSDKFLIDVIEVPNNKDVNDLSENEFNNLKIVSGNDWIYKN